jgi:RNA polymerase sigma-70 factor, ECF subfamily
MDSDDDANLVARVLAGDRSAFGVLIDRHRAGVLAFARRLVSRADAEDVVQDALIAAFLAMGDLRAPERFKSWLLGIVADAAQTPTRRIRR